MCSGRSPYTDIARAEVPKAAQPALHVLTLVRKKCRRGKGVGGALTLWVPSVEDGDGEGAVHLVLTGDDDSVEETALGCVVQSVRQGDRGTELHRLHVEAEGSHAASHKLSVVPVRREALSVTSNCGVCISVHTCTGDICHILHSLQHTVYRKFSRIAKF